MQYFFCGFFDVDDREIIISGPFQVKVANDGSKTPRELEVFVFRLVEILNERWVAADQSLSGRFGSD